MGCRIFPCAGTFAQCFVPNLADFDVVGKYCFPCANSSAESRKSPDDFILGRHQVCLMLLLGRALDAMLDVGVEVR